LVNFFMMYDIDIHELNLGPFKYLKFLDEISFKICVLFAFLNNKCTIISFFKKKPLPYQKRKRFYRWAFHYFFNFFYFDNF